MLCEIIAGGPVHLEILHQIVTADVPQEVRDYLPGDNFIERQVCLSAGGEVMMDNLSYIALDGLPPEIRCFLQAGSSPIGHLFGRRWTRKTALPDLAGIQRRLWERSGLPDPSAVRGYRLDMPHGPCMLITETFRAGMRLGLPLAPAASLPSRESER